MFIAPKTWNLITSPMAVTLILMRAILHSGSTLLFTKYFWFLYKTYELSMQNIFINMHTLFRYTVDLVSAIVFLELHEMLSIEISKKQNCPPLKLNCKSTLFTENILWSRRASGREGGTSCKGDACAVPFLPSALHLAPPPSWMQMD